jgi:hypothetical protein
MIYRIYNVLDQKKLADQSKKRQPSDLKLQKPT